MEVTQMMGIGPEVFSAWKAEYAELFDKLISIFAGPDRRRNHSRCSHEI
jgi:hypothetical protein